MQSWLTPVPCTPQWTRLINTIERRDSNSQTLDAKRCEVVIAYPTLLEAYSLVLYRLGIAAAHQMDWVPRRRRSHQS